MFSVFLEKIIVFLFIFNFYSFVGAGPVDDLKDDNIDRGSRSDRGGLWFGPRLGKRSLQLTGENDRHQAFLRLLAAADAVKFYYDQLPYYDAQADDPDMQVTKKVIFTPKLGRSLNKMEDKRFETVDFTPRLGRRISQPAMPNAGEGYRPEPDQDNRLKYFSPRLGRNNMNFSPRLGREISYELYPENVRVVRSANKTKSDEK